MKYRKKGEIIELRNKNKKFLEKLIIKKKSLFEFSFEIAFYLFFNKSGFFNGKIKQTIFKYYKANLSSITNIRLLVV